MCFKQYTTLACPGCGHHFPYSVDVPIRCPESLHEPHPGIGVCFEGVKQTFVGPGDEQEPSASSSDAPDSKSRYGQSYVRVRNRFAQMPNPLGEGAPKYQYALREYALACLYNPNELLEGDFDPLATAHPGWEGGHMAELQKVPFVIGGGMAYRTMLQNLGESIVRHSCNEV
ncbi:hypothetical protein PG999_005426 [Apiospora kogelbergensis]|uniref:Uncharacterized protein n=1 Tax=Apiospora kogelbergensis TaxID=1337665 RepID=A0AAW0R261_9PEZI